MTANQFRKALDTLGWSYSTASEKLQVASESRIGHWARGERPVPPYIAASIRAHLKLQECRDQLRGQ